MTKCIYLDNIFYEHRPWFPHPENPERLRRLLEGLQKTGLFNRFEQIGVPKGNAREELALLVHTKSYVDMVREASREGRALLDPDTYVSEKTYEAALAVLASAEDAAKRIEEGDCRVAFIPGRPPGHHAGRSGPAMGAPTLGFCIFNASALVSTLLSQRGHRVLHIDFDLHHGNGTQEILYDNPLVVHVDFHQDPATIYPGTGWPWQTGSGEAKGTKMNIVLPAGSGDDVFAEAVDRVIGLLDRAGFRPTRLVFSAGFDGYIGDGLGALRLTSNSYYYLAKRMREAYGLPVIIVWEGGYDAGLVRGAPSFLAAILGMDKPYREQPTVSRPTVKNLFQEKFSELEAHVL